MSDLIVLGIVYVYGVTVGFFLERKPKRNCQSATTAGYNNVIVQSGDDTYVNGKKIDDNRYASCDKCGRGAGY